MDDHSLHACGFCLCHEFKPTLHDKVLGAKRLLDSSEEVQALHSVVKKSVLSHHCSTPDPSKKLPLCSPDSASFQGSSDFLDDTGHDDLVASSSASRYNDVAISLDTSRSFDDSEPDDSLLELSDSEVGNSPFNYTEDEIQEILAEDHVESERYLRQESTLSQNGNGESEEDESSSCTGASISSEGTSVASEIPGTPNEPLSRESSSPGSELHPSLSDGSVSLDEHHPPSAQVSGMFFDLDLQELLSLSPIDGDCVDEPLEDDSLEEAKRESSEEIQSGRLEVDEAASSCVLRESLEELLSHGRQSLGVSCLGGTPFVSRDASDSCGDHLERSMSSSDPASSQSRAERRAAPVLVRCPTPSSGSRIREAANKSKATKRSFSRKLKFPEDDEGQESSAAERPSNSMKLSEAAVGQIEQEETSSGRKPVPQEESPKRRMRFSEVELEQKKR